uniref:DNA-directed RNA polymerase subunit alpha n=1 Tax=Sagittaria lichuanensis TaxID=258219 RepID=A0A142CRZ8_9LILI|nr:RNA polymerase alpha subunit [Sagittaria lichuanensis]AMQ13523.1 RNA polymerase alpha subunit [Sagittaria lichuanensis]UDZ61096.1 RNA polymerase alpha subunit [Sagittaria lichuanensis]
MVREEVAESTRTLQWKCVESRVERKRLYYGRFVLFPLLKGQADTIGIAMRRVLLGEIEGTCITGAKLEGVPHEYSTIEGIDESVQEILMNLKEIVLRSNLYGVRNAFICVKGPKCVTAQDIISPPSVKIVDTTQHIANLTEPLDLCIELQITRDRGYRKKSANPSQDGSYPIDAVSMPVRNTNYSIYSYGNEEQEILFLEIWTNGSLTPKEALYEASRNLIDLFIPFLHAEEENTNLEENKNKSTFLPFTFHNEFGKKNQKGLAFKSVFIDQLELPSRTYNCLKRSNIHTLLDLLSNSEEDFMKMEFFRIEDVKQISSILQKRFGMDLPKNPVSF